MKKLFELVKENNAAKLVLGILLFPTILLLLAAILLVGKEVMEEFWNLLCGVWKIAFPSWETALSQVINAIYHFILGGAVLSVIATTRMKKLIKQQEDLEEYDQEEAA